MNAGLSYSLAVDLLKSYNKDQFHLTHAATVSGVMRWFANELGYSDDEEFWAEAGLLHDIDFELFPNEHCIKARGILSKAGASDELCHTFIAVVEDLRTRTAVQNICIPKWRLSVRFSDCRPFDVCVSI